MTSFAVRVVTGLTLAACLSAPAFAASVAVNRMWKGQELWPFMKSTQRKYEQREEGWRSMPGVLMFYSYSGTGPLPPPEEVVIPLEKPLPLGAYRLFVKNFRVGKMEATLGDVTKPLTIRRFDWTPGEVFE